MILLYESSLKNSTIAYDNGGDGGGGVGSEGIGGGATASSRKINSTEFNLFITLIGSDMQKFEN